MRCFFAAIGLWPRVAPLPAQTECRAPGYGGPAGRACPTSADAPQAFHPLAGALGLRYGVRVGVFHGAFGVPAISVSIMRRHLPRLQYGDLATGDSVQFSTDLGATNIRAVASMRVLLLEFAGGVGWDRYSSTAEVAFLDPTRPLSNPQRIPLDLRNTREMLFL